MRLPGALRLRRCAGPSCASFDALHTAVHWAHAQRGLEKQELGAAVLSLAAPWAGRTQLLSDVGFRQVPPASSGRCARLRALTSAVFPMPLLAVCSLEGRGFSAVHWFGCGGLACRPHVTLSRAMHVTHMLLVLGMWAALRGSELGGMRLKGWLSVRWPVAGHGAARESWPQRAVAGSVLPRFGTWAALEGDFPTMVLVGIAIDFAPARCTHGPLDELGTERSRRPSDSV
jgi:hypothetical protein